MARRANEVEAGMNAQVSLVLSLRLLLLAHVCLMLVVNKLDNWEPGVAVVDVVSKSRGIDDGQLDLELALFQLSLDDFDFGQLVKLLVVTLGVVFGR